MTIIEKSALNTLQRRSKRTITLRHVPGVWTVMADGRSGGEQSICPNPSCSVGRWIVKPSLEYPEVWLIVANPDENPFVVASTVPVCPLDGRILLRG